VAATSATADTRVINRSSVLASIDRRSNPDTASAVTRSANSTIAVAPAVIRNRSDPFRLPVMRTDPVSAAANRLDHVGAEFAAQRRDVNFDDVVVAVEHRIPHVAHDVAFRNDFALVNE
jgi:hypothetical protein